MTDPLTKYVIQRFVYQWEDYGYSFTKSSAEEWYTELCEQYESGCVNTRFRLLERTDQLLTGMQPPDWANKPVNAA